MREQTSALEQAPCHELQLTLLNPRAVLPTFVTQSNVSAAANTIRILVATDNHVGYAERDPVRGNDSFTTFNEIMELAKEQDVPLPKPQPS